jgi:hypothetical protein
MLTPTLLKKTGPLTMNPTSGHGGLNSLFAAAVVSSTFRELLLKDPEQALKQGYMGQEFSLSPEDASLIVSINAASLPDLARQVVQTLSP